MDGNDERQRAASMMDVDPLATPSPMLTPTLPNSNMHLSAPVGPPAMHSPPADAVKPVCPYMPDIPADMEVEDYVEFTWRIPSFTTLRAESAATRKAYSPNFTVGTEEWRILMFPNGNNVDSVSLYLDYAHPTEIPPKWHRCIQFAIRMHNPFDPTVGIAREAHHRFGPEEADWGFTQFHRFVELSTVSPEHSRPIVENDAVDVTVYVRLIKDPTGTLWHNFVNWDSRQETGHVGLKNQGATCYMNSLLQSLYFTNPFRKAVFQIPTDKDEPTKSLALALQRLFYSLQHSAGAGDTRELTKSFGWDSVDAFMQHDVQEFNRVLQDSLELRMKGTAAEGAIERLFVGKMKSYIKCVNVEFESAREETFYDIQLNVKGMANLFESFKDYVAVEMLDGENKYQAEGFGLQDAKKGVIFTKLPPVLHLQLKRFEYDFERDAMVKINDRHEYPLQIDLGSFIDESVQAATGPQIYNLHGVLVHIGDVNGGHYCAFLKPEKDGKWFKFDDDRVTPVTTKEVLEDNYGGEVGNIFPSTRQSRLHKRFTNAYMLVYIRQSDSDAVLAPILPTDIPSHLSANIEKEQAEKERIHKEAMERHLFIDIKVMTTADLKDYQGFDLFPGPTAAAGATQPPFQSFRTRKDSLFGDFKKHVAEHFKLDEETIRLWSFYRRQNATVRPERPLVAEKGYMDKTVDEVLSEGGVSKVEISLYLEVSSRQVNDSVTGQLVYFYNLAPESVVIWIKYYDPFSTSLRFLGPVHVKLNMKTEDLFPILNALCGNPPATPIKIYEEIKPGMVDLLKPKQSLSASEILLGDILCFQKELPKELEKDYEFPLAVQYYDFLQNRVFIRLQPRMRPRDEKEEEKWKADGVPFAELQLALSKKLTYDQFAQRVAKQLHQPDFLKMRFWLNPSGQDFPKQPIKRNANQTLHEIISSNNYWSAVPPSFWYEPLDISIAELDTKRQVRVTWVDQNNHEGDTISVLMAKDSVLNDVIEAAAEKLNLTSVPMELLRLVEVVGNRQIRDMKPNAPLATLQDYGCILCLEQIHETEQPQGPDDALICVFHFAKDVMYPHSIPFRFMLRPGEVLADTKKRLQTRIGMGDKEFSKVKFSLVRNGSGTVLDKDDTVLFDVVELNDSLGLDHLDRSVSSKRHGGFEKAIKIHN